MFLLISFFFLPVCFLFWTDSSFVTVFNRDDNSTKDYWFNSPPFGMGSMNFPVTGLPIIVKGCKGIPNIDEETLFKNHPNSTKFVVVVEFNQYDSSCFETEQIFNCQEREWCLGVLFEENFAAVAGRICWSNFDKKRPRSAYKVPFVSMIPRDIDKVVSLTISGNSTITLTKDPNPWQEMLTSVGFLVIFQIIIPITSFIFLIFALAMLKENTRQERRRSRKNSIHKKKCSPKPNLTLKKICLILQAITLISRFLYCAVDPFWSQEIFPSVVSYTLHTCCISFEIATNMLLASVIRELTDAKQLFDVMKKVNFVYCFISVFLIVDFGTAILAGLRINSQYVQTWIVKVVFYVILNIFLGFYYLWQGKRFLKMVAAQERRFKIENMAKKSLTQVAMVNSIGLILFGIVIIFVSIVEIQGTPWGYFSLYVILVALLQSNSFLQICLFGGYVFRFKKVTHYFRTTLATQSSNTINI